MFKELRILKISLLLILLFIGGVKTYQRYQLTFILLEKTSLNPNEVIKLSVASTNNNSFNFNLSSFLTDSIILDTLLVVNKSFSKNEDKNHLEEGYFNASNVSLSFDQLKLPNGFYLANGKIPILINDDKDADITIVYPFANNHFYSPSDDEYVFDSTYAKVSLNREVEIDANTKSLKSLFSVLSKRNRVSYITDLDLENTSKFANSKMLLIYGDLVFWSPKMYANLKEYVANGGNVLMMSSNLFYSKFNYNLSEKSLSLYSDSTKVYPKNAKQFPWNNYKQDTSELFSYLHNEHGGVIEQFSTFDSINFSHHLLKGIDDLSFEAENFLGIPYVNYLNGPEVQGEYKTKIEIVANSVFYVGDYPKSAGIFLISYGKGKILSLGSSELCLKVNQENKNLRKLLNNSVDFLISEELKD